MAKRQISLLLLLAVCLSVRAFAQVEKKPLTNTDVVDMVRAGLADSTIMLSIQNSSASFDTSPQALIELKKNGVSQKVMEAMLSMGSKGSASVSSTPAPMVSAASGLSDSKALMAKVVSALGGAKAISEVKATRYTSTREVKTPAIRMTLEAQQTTVYPDRVHVALKSPQFSSVTVYRPDGAYVLVNGQPQSFPEAAQKEILKSIKFGIIYVSQHVNDPEYTFAINGSEKIGNSETTVLEISTDGMQARWNVDPVSGRIIRVTRMVAGADGVPMLTQFEYADWHTISGVMVPFKILKNSVPAEEIKTYEINPAVPAGLFDRPGIASAAPAVSSAPASTGSTSTRPGGAVTVGAGPNSAWKQPLFRDVRKKYENTTVLVLGNPSALRVLGHMTDWHLANQKKGRYVEIEKYLEFKYIGQTAKVIAVQLEHNSISEAHRLGPDDDDTLYPYFSLVVRFDDGTTAMTTTYPVIAKDLAVPAEEAARHEAAIRAGASAMLGKTVYAIAYSHFYYPDLKLVDAVEVVRTGYATTSVDQVRDVPHLQPLTVTKAGFLKAGDALLLTLALPDGRSVLSVVACDGKDASCYGNYGSELFAEIPSKLTPQEVDAIRHRTFVKGMTKEALYMSIGLPERENDYGQGGYQLVFANGKVLIYTDADGKITDSQAID